MQEIYQNQTNFTDFWQSAEFSMTIVVNAMLNLYPNASNISNQKSKMAF